MKIHKVGKTTVAIELCTALARFYGKRTLLVDIDPQASATFYVMEHKRWVTWKYTNGSTADLFALQHRHFPIRKATVKDVLQDKAAVFGFDLLPSSPDLIDIDLRLADFPELSVPGYSGGSNGNSFDDRPTREYEDA